MQNEEQKIITVFADDMARKLNLRLDRYSPMGWKSLDFKRLIWLLEGEIMELKELYNRKDEGNAVAAKLNYDESVVKMRDCAVDIANYAMFIYEKNK